MIYEDLNCIFVRVPRTGTISIRSLFNTFANTVNVYSGDESTSLKDPHLTLSEIKDIIFTDSKYERFRNKYYSMFKFGFVRNPFDRIVSLYHYLKKGGSIENLHFKDFNDFIENYYNKFDYWDWFDKRIQQYKWVEGCDFVGKFENLENDIHFICSKLGVSEDKVNLCKVNDSDHYHYSQYYNQKSIKFVYKKEYKTIEKFGYIFENLKFDTVQLI